MIFRLDSRTGKNGQKNTVNSLNLVIQEQPLIGVCSVCMPSHPPRHTHKHTQTHTNTPTLNLSRNYHINTLIFAHNKVVNPQSQKIWKNHP